MRNTTLAGALSSLLLALTGTSHAYYVETRTPDMTPVRFADGDETTSGTVDITYRINPLNAPGGEATLTAIRAAFQTWTDAECSTVAFTEGPPSEMLRQNHWEYDEGDVYVLVYFDNSDAQWNTGRSVGAFYFAHDGVGQMIGATVVLNSRDHQWATDGSAGALDVQGTATALIGRALGLTSSMAGNATYPSYAPGDITKRTLGTDDLAGVQYLYASTEATCTAPPPPQAVCTGSRIPGEMECPPRPMLVGDAGTGIPNRDAGPTIVYRDAGVDAAYPDSGINRDPPGNCGCRTVGTRSQGGAAALALIALGALVVRRRRKL